MGLHEKIFQVGAELFNAAGEAVGHNEAKSRFSQFCERRTKIAGNKYWVCRQYLKLCLKTA